MGEETEVKRNVAMEGGRGCCTLTNCVAELAVVLPVQRNLHNPNQLKHWCARTIESSGLLDFELKVRISSKIIFSKDSELELVPTSPTKSGADDDRNPRTLDYTPGSG
jgi:hypothetical protein